MAEPLYFQDLILRLTRFWADQGCLLWQPMNTEVGAGTMNPATFLRVLGGEPWRVAYVEPSIRPDDARYGDNPNRLQMHTQYQVILKPDPGDPQGLYLDSLRAIGIDVDRHDVRFVEDNWQSPALGAWGLGWEVWLDGLEITQFTYFQQAGGQVLDPPSVELTYGLERIAMGSNDVTHFKEIPYAPGISYGDVLARNEYEMSRYYLDAADVERARELFDAHEAEAKQLLEERLAVPAYLHVLRTSHLFNVLDARGAVGVTERARYMGRMRALSRAVAEVWVEEAGAPEQSRAAIGLPEPGDHPEIAEPATVALELGTEELPPRELDTALAHFRTALPDALARAGVDMGSMSVAGTPRRIAVVAEGLRRASGGGAQVARGPRADVAWDENGEPTKAGAGFARKHGLAPEDLDRVEHEGVEYAAATVQPERLAALVTRALGEVSGKVPFAETMRWNESGVAFSRPVRWIVALIDDALLPFAFAGVGAGRTTRGFRDGDPVEVDVADADAYLDALEQVGVVVDVERRRDAIQQGVDELATAEGGAVPDDPGLLAEVANLVESPTPMLGHFEPEFLELPADILITVMRKHQRYFPVLDSGGAMLPAFVAVANGQIDVDAVRAGNEAVLRARFADARFFFEQDQKEPLEAYRPKLATLVFQEKLGSMGDKADRVEALATKLAERLLDDGGEREVVAAAAALAKNDLATRMVAELSSLAGVIGAEYARRGEKPEPVAAAIREHVLPASAGDRLPESGAGAVLSVADRLDSLVGLLAAGVKITATADPFGLRRAALGLLQVLDSHGFDIDLEEAVRLAADAQPIDVSDEGVAGVLEFAWRRFEVWRRDRGERADVIRAALAGSAGSVPAKVRAIRELEESVNTDEFADVLRAYLRAARIVRSQEAGDTVDPDLFEEDAERALWDAVSGVNGDGIGSLESFVRVFKPLVEPIDRFFEQVFVMADDKRVAANRLALLRRVAELPRPVADLTELQEPAKP
jgi:glycyl-tRNA synthetase